ncbi:DUF6600 domain-containing protein [Massilia oculi]|uniref:Uncharacterized protein n=1 Tax=Massilia oculi TaxID=945844 RepID=A0A2S2DK17_9BURK|nr:DUF6600 domain-containing protein [Massilia oculi]AWL05429.1 hypothetical protein DIR46_13950 [Massilia oculi]
MTHRLIPTAAVFALAAISTCAPAQTVLQTDPPGQIEATGNGVMETEPPGRVGRVSLVQGQVEIGGDVGAESSAAVVNWPVTTRNLVTTSPGARTEIRIGSTSIRLDGDSSLEFTELDDDRLRLRLHFGSASIRVMNSEVVPEFELRTAQATVRLTQPGRLRVDADRVPDTSLVSVLDGEAQVDGAGASLTVRTGRAAEVRDEDVRTQQARRDGFDDWALTRDQTLVAEQSSRHIGTEMTGYEELDRYGSWSTHSDYGSLWTPTVVASDWTPYRDGQWSYIAPWGWTWVDNAPWGYAPFHYGRWVQVHNRWAWAPGRLERRPVWSPALVGWVGGGNWSVGFASHNLHAHGWYPLSPYDRYVPGYRLSSERLRRLNDWRHATRRAAQQRPGHLGLTVVPREHFGGRGPVVVPRAPRPDRPNFALPRGQGSAPPPPLVARADWNRGNDARRELLERREVRQRLETGQVTRDGFVQDRRLEPDPMARQRESNERLSRERMQQQERVVRQQEERDRMQRDLDNRMQADRLGFGRHAEREREQRERMRERAERSQQLQQQRPPAMATNPAPSFSRPEPRPMPRPDVRPPPQMETAPPPRPAPPPQMVAPPAPRPQSSTPAFTPRGGGEQRAHTNARGQQIQER